MVLQDIAAIIGMPRTGTTWLYENLKAHPDVCTSDYKEINRYLLGLTDEQYFGFFGGGSGRVKLDASPLYYFDKEALLKIAANHDKVILLVREEKEWIASLRAQFSKWDPNVDARTTRFVYQLGGGKKLTFDYSTYQHDLYLREVKRIFGDKLLVLDYALLQREPITLLKLIEAYLGIRPYFNAETCSLEKINTREQQMSKFYALLIRTNVLDKFIPVALKILPKSLVHWLRRRLVYGDKT